MLTKFFRQSLKRKQKKKKQKTIVLPLSVYRINLFSTCNWKRNWKRVVPFVKDEKERNKRETAK